MMSLDVTLRNHVSENHELSTTHKKSGTNAIRKMGCYKYRTQVNNGQRDNKTRNNVWLVQEIKRCDREWVLGAKKEVGVATR